MSRSRSVYPSIFVLLPLSLFFLTITSNPVHAAPAPANRTQSSRALMRPSTAPNPFLDIDMQINVPTGGTHYSAAAEGWLHLVPKGTGLAGTFVDNFASGKVYPASASGASVTGFFGTYTINTGNGKFSFTYGTPGFVVNSVPAKYGKGATMTFTWVTHAYTANPPLATVFGGINYGQYIPQTHGSLSLTYDAMHFIVPFNSKVGSTSGFTYSPNGKSRFIPITSWGVFHPFTGHGGGAITFMVLKLGSFVFSFNSLIEYDNTTPVFYGYGNAERGSTTTQIDLSAQ